MTLALLVKALSKHMRSILDSYHTAQGEGADGKGELKKVEVFEWFIPFSDPRKKATTDFPYVEVRVPKAKKERPKSLVTVEMTFCVFSQATSTADGLQRPDGAYDLVNLIEHVQTQLMRCPTIDGRFRMEQRCEITIPDEQPYPYFIGVMETQWELPFVIDEEGAVKAYG